MGIRMNWLTRLINGTIHLLTEIACRIEDKELEKVPAEGPLIIVGNHINFLELPLMYTHLQPREMTGFSKVENWDVPLFRFLFDQWGIIPIERGAADVGALRRGLEALQKGGILVIAPEGTRSHNGRLQKGLPGVVLIALRSGAPVQPVVYYGGEKIKQNLKRLRRTDFHIIVGNPFHIDTGGVKVTGEVRQHIVDEIMYQMAALLPAGYRGVYHDLENATETYLRFAEPDQSNLRRWTA
ncbi:MAG: 1-acyl-sn-glycerol-3-phosphate acyltransferase [Anaerolineae bacterium]|nr:1-acyl-sn-glycerol-3-phosphate acyltransferase [Anaerolineae bacterium]